MHIIRLSEQSIDSIARFIGYGKVIACYSGMGYAEQQLQAKLHRAIYASDIMPHSSLRWTGDIEKDIKYEERRLDIPSKLREPYIPIDQMASLQYIEKQHPNCTGCTLLCFMPPTLKSQLGRTIEAFKQRQRTNNNRINMCVCARVGAANLPRPFSHTHHYTCYYYLEEGER